MTRQEKAMGLEVAIVKVCEKLENVYELLEYDEDGDTIDNDFNRHLERYLEELDNYLTFGTYVEDDLYSLLDKVDNVASEVQNETNS